MGVLQDLTGKTFGRLTVIKRAENNILPSGQRQTMWLCKCSCGNNKDVIVRGADLKKRTYNIMWMFKTRSKRKSIF